MSHTKSQNSWRKTILQRLEDRNKRECQPFENVIATCKAHLELVDSLQREKLILENNPSLSLNAANEKLNALNNELKSFKQQSNDDAKAIEELRTQLDSERKEKNELKVQLENALAKLETSQAKCFELEQTVQDQQSQLVVAKDEHTALQILYSSVLQKLEKLEHNYTEIVARWMALKARDAEELNEENERMIKIQNEKMKKELEEAVSEMVVNETINMGDDDLKMPNPLVVVSTLPSSMLYSFDGHEGEVNAIRWDQKNEILYTGGGDRKVKTWSLGSTQQTLESVLTGSNASITSIDLNSEYLVASSNDMASRVWSRTNTKFCHTFTGHSNKVHSVKFLSSSNNVISGSADKTLKIWDINKNSCVRTIFASSTCHDLVSINCAGCSIASAHYDKKIRFWDARSENIANNIQLQGIITSLDVSSDDRYLLTSVRDDSLKCLDLRMSQVIRDYVADGFRVGFNWTRARFSPDDRYVACGASDGSIYIWDFLTARLEKTLSNRAHSSNPVIAVEWGPQGQVFLSADRNKKIVVWK